MQNQHFVPKFLLKNFADTDGKVFRFDKSSDFVDKLAPKYAASEGDFYEFERDGEVLSFEGRFQSIETKAAPRLRRIIEANSLASTSAEDRSHIATFIAAQAFRTQAFLSNLKERPTREKLGSVLENLWASSFITAEMITQRHWILMAIEGDEVFYLGDQPVVLQHTADPNGVLHLGFDILGVEAYLPISPKHAIYMPCRSISDEIISAYQGGVKTLGSLWKVGRGISPEAFATQQSVKRLKPLYEGLTMGSAVPSVPETVLNLNYLQCSWSNQWTFSNKRDFSTAKLVLSKTPQYRTPPATSVASLFSHSES